MPRGSNQGTTEVDRVYRSRIELVRPEGKSGSHRIEKGGYGNESMGRNPSKMKKPKGM
jgi:hypothetical protein